MNIMYVLTFQFISNLCHSIHTPFTLILLISLLHSAYYIYFAHVYLRAQLLGILDNEGSKLLLLPPLSLSLTLSRSSVPFERRQGRTIFSGKIFSLTLGCHLIIRLWDYGRRRLTGQREEKEKIRKRREEAVEEMKRLRGRALGKILKATATGSDESRRKRGRKIAQSAFTACIELVV